MTNASAERPVLPVGASTIESPYDAEITRLSARPVRYDVGLALEKLRDKAEGYRRGALDERAKAAVLVEALLVALRAPTCPCCGRDNPDLGNGSECTSDDCPGVQALAAYEKEA